MKVWLKRVLISLVVVFLVALVGIAIFLLTFDPNAYKNKLEEVVYNRYQRSLTIKGDIELSLFPRIGLSVEDVSLSNRNSTDTFASIDSARFAVAIWPLMFNRLVVDHVAVTGFKAWVTRDEEGLFNFRDLIDRPGAALGMMAPSLAVKSLLPTARAQELPANLSSDAVVSVSASGSAQSADLQIDIAGLDLKEGEIHFYDNVSGAVGRIEKLEVNTGRMTANQAFDVALKGKLKGEYPVADANIEGQALVLFNPDQKSYSAQKINVVANGLLGSLAAKSATLRGNLAYSAYSQMLSASNLEFLVQGEIQGETPVKGFETSLSVPQLKVDRSQAELKVEKLAYRAKGSTPDQAFEVAFDAPNLAISPESATGAPIAGTVKLSKPNQVLGITLGMSGIGGNASKLTLKELKIDAGLKEGNRLVQLKMSSPASWDVFGEVGGLSAMQGDVKIEDAALPGGSFAFPFIGSLRADLIKDELASEINAVLSGSKLDFGLNATQLSDPKFVFDLTADKLDFNTLFPPAIVPAPEAADAPADAAKSDDAAKTTSRQPGKAPTKAEETFELPRLSFLDSGDLTGTISIDELKIQEIEARKFAAKVSAAQGKLSITGVKAELYGGTLSGTLGATSKNEVSANLTLSKVALEPLLQALVHENRLSGRGTVKLELASQGTTGAALEAGLNGTAKLSIRDGAITGIDLAQTLREVNAVVRNMFSGQLPEVASKFDSARKTDFTALDALINFNQGQGTIKTLKVASPLLRITQGTPATLDLVNDQLDIMVDVNVVNTSTGQDGKALADLKGVTIPVRISGPFGKPGYQVQWKDVSSDVVKDAVKGGLIDLLSNQIGQSGKTEDGQAAPKSSTDSVKSIGDALKGLLGK
ncbi:AsmA family protein [Pollutimonas harenae]|uniref:AsmA family protein n=1 Tax=Pollutimonas harenae TaxID=657015 RepID=A0A853H092_9BURK|nr:AsmA family protein [Pollutimonas harenae]NYT83993.1 AsmA family protein [Pollutimonas harenae]TEA73580.1 AsmA family protein [Pollutimonas harenae]